MVLLLMGGLAYALCHIAKHKAAQREKIHLSLFTTTTKSTLALVGLAPAFMLLLLAVALAVLVLPVLAIIVAT